MCLSVFLFATLVCSTALNQQHIKCFKDLCIAHPDSEQLLKDLEDWKLETPMESTKLNERLATVIRDYNAKLLIADMSLRDRKVSDVLADLEGEAIRDYGDEELQQLNDELKERNLDDTLILLNSIHEQFKKMDVILATRIPLGLLGPSFLEFTRYLSLLTKSETNKMELLIGSSEDIKGSRINHSISIMVRAYQLAREEVVFIAGRKGQPFVNLISDRHRHVDRMYATHLGFMDKLNKTNLINEAARLAACHAEWVYTKNKQTMVLPAEEGYFIFIMGMAVGVAVGGILASLSIGCYKGNKIDLPL